MAVLVSTMRNQRQNMKSSCMFLQCGKIDEKKALLKGIIECLFGRTFGLWSTLKLRWRVKWISLGVPSFPVQMFVVAGFPTENKKQKKRISCNWREHFYLHRWIRWTGWYSFYHFKLQVVFVPFLHSNREGILA